MEIILFGDQVADIHPSLLKLYRLSKRSTFLTIFLQSSTDVLLSAVACLAPSERLHFSFRTLLELSESHLRSSCKHSAVSTVLLSVTQLGWLLVYATSPHVLYRDPILNIHIVKQS